MQALELAIRNFAVAEHLLDLEQLFADAAAYQPATAFSLALCTELSLPPGSALQHVRNSRAVLGVQGSIHIPACLTTEQGMDFLLRQAVLVTCSALESFIWDILRENTLTVIKAKGRKADATLREVTLTLDDYLSLEDYADPDERLKEIILRRFERGTLYDLAKIDEIMKILTVQDVWKVVKTHTGLEAATIRTQLSELISRRNEITHRADRPKENTPPEELDPHGLRPITLAWTSMRISTAKTFVRGVAAAVESAIEQLTAIMAQREEQRLARETIRRSEPAPAKATEQEFPSMASVPVDSSPTVSP